MSEHKNTLPVAKVEPLKKRTMTLDQLQVRILEVLRLARAQFNRAPYEDGMSDGEFLENIISTFETEIRQDRHILRLAKKARKE